MKVFFIALGLGVMLSASYLPVNANAQDSPITFQKQRFIIHPGQATTGADSLLLDIDIRSAGSQQNPDWMQLAAYPYGTGLLEIYTTSEPLTLTQNQSMAACDVIAFNDYGQVVMIVPNITLGRLSAPIHQPLPIRAVLYTSPGFAEQSGLMVGDTAEHRIFSPIPVILDATTPHHTPTPENTTQETTDSAAPAPQSEPAAAPVQPPEDIITRRRPAANPPAPPAPLPQEPAARPVAPDA